MDKSFVSIASKGLLKGKSIKVFPCTCETSILSQLDREKKLYH